MRLAALLICISMSAHAEFKDGNKLLQNMNASEYFSQGVAFGYITGVADMGQGIVHCMPANVTVGQIHDMVKNYLTNTPAERHHTADIIVNKVLKATWPCPRRDRPA